MYLVISRSNTSTPYFYMDKSNYKFVLGDLETAKRHKFTFNTYEINYLRYEIEDFDNLYKVEKFYESDKQMATR